MENDLLVSPHAHKTKRTHSARCSLSLSWIHVLDTANAPVCMERSVCLSLYRVELRAGEFWFFGSSERDSLLL